MQAPSYPVTQPPSVLVSEHKVIPMQFEPLVVHLSLIHLQEVLLFQVKLLHDVYLKQAPFVPSLLGYLSIHKQGPLDPSIQAALTEVYSQF